MVQTCSIASINDLDVTHNPNSIIQQLIAITSKLSTINVLAIEVASPIVQLSNYPHAKASHKDQDQGKAPYEEVDDANSPWGLKNLASRPHTKTKFPKFDNKDP